jgi:hypothetical protein
MYWLRLRRLKEDLIANRLTEHGAFPYFLAVLIVDAILVNSTFAFPGGDSRPTLATFGNIVIPVIIITAATLLLYRTNGGANGRFFFVRYFPLLWVIGIRFVPLAIALCAAWIYLFADPEHSSATWADVAVWNAFYALYYWRVWVHFREVSSRATAT